MVLPSASVIPPSPTAVSTGEELSDEETRQAIIRTMTQDLAQELPTLDLYRRYYDGEQSLMFGAAKFREEFGEAFASLRDDWCGVVVDAIADRLEVEGVIVEGQEPDSEPAKTLWRVFRDNDFDEQQEDLHEGALVEGRAAVIVWPDPELGARIDWQPAQNVIVRYSDEDYRVAVAALKRWVNADNQILLTFYTPEAVYKYWGGAETDIGIRRGGRSAIPATSPNAYLAPRRVPGEPWPLPNPLGEVPVVEFINKGGSELTKVVPLQDALNYLLIAALGASAYAALPQWVLFTLANEPEGGWINSPGRVWKVPPTLDADGKAIESKLGTFEAGNLSQFRELIEMILQHVALASKTPVRMFFHSDRGGRGDAPSGESLLIDDEPLLDKVEKKQTRFGNSWFRVAKLVADAANIDLGEEVRGEMRWKDPRAKYRTLLLDEAEKMWELGKMKTGETRVGIPMDYIIKQIALPPDDADQIIASLEEQQAEIDAAEEEQKALQQEQMDNEQANAEAQIEAQANQPAGGGGNGNPSPRPSNR